MYTHKVYRVHSACAVAEHNNSLVPLLLALLLLALLLLALLLLAPPEYRRQQVVLSQYGLQAAMIGC